MEAQKITNGTEQSQTPTTNPYMTFFKELSPAEARPLKRRVRIEGELHTYIMRVLHTVRDGKEVYVPADFPVAEKALKANIKKVARDSKDLDVAVRFDKAIAGGFIVRKASVDEQVQGDRTGERLGGMRRKK